MRRNTNIAAGLAASAIAVASCGGGGGSASSSGGAYSQGGGTQASTAPSAPAAATVKVSKTDLGRILTDAKGRTLYLFEKDNGIKSACAGACAADWPPLMAKGQPTLAGGLAMSKLGTTARAGGARQVTFGGHPLYYFAGDKAAGQTAGQGLKSFGAEWYALSASGSKVDKDDS